MMGDRMGILRAVVFIILRVFKNDLNGLQLYFSRLMLAAFLKRICKATGFNVTLLYGRNKLVMNGTYKGFRTPWCVSYLL